ncbi:hypothetical protein QL285_058243 [Trifolium repens]|nr:hypothetical protein QL285_058243 [Trifolium repens]
MALSCCDALLRPITKTINRASHSLFYSFRNSRILSTIRRGSEELYWAEFSPLTGKLTQQGILEFEYDPEPERTLWKRRQAQRLATSSSLKIKEEPTTKAMGDEQRITMGDYCKRTDTDQISLGFQPANLANFDIKGNVLTGLRENQFDGRANNDPWDHLAMFSETCQIQKVPDSVTDDQKKLRLFAFSLTGPAKDWLQCLPRGTIATWKELEDNAMEQMQLFTAGMKMQHRMILDASAGGSIKVKTYAETKDLVEQMCQNEYNMSHDRAEKTPGDLKVDQEIAYKVEIELLRRQLADKEKAVKEANVKQVEGVCDFCLEDHPNGQCLPGGSEEQVNYMGNNYNLGVYCEIW